MLVCFCLTLYVVFDDQDLSKIMGYVKAARSGYWAVSAGLVIVFILSESVIIFYLMRSLGEKPRLDHCFPVFLRRVLFQPGHPFRQRRPAGSGSLYEEG